METFHQNIKQRELNKVTSLSNSVTARTFDGSVNYDNVLRRLIGTCPSDVMACACDLVHKP